LHATTNNRMARWCEVPAPAVPGEKTADRRASGGRSFPLHFSSQGPDEIRRYRDDPQARLDLLLGMLTQADEYHRRSPSLRLAREYALLRGCVASQCHIGESAVHACQVCFERAQTQF